MTSSSQHCTLAQQVRHCLPSAVNMQPTSVPFLLQLLVSKGGRARASLRNLQHHSDPLSPCDSDRKTLEGTFHLENTLSGFTASRSQPSSAEMGTHHPEHDTLHWQQILPELSPDISLESVCSMTSFLKTKLHGLA